MEMFLQSDLRPFHLGNAAGSPLPRLNNHALSVLIHSHSIGCRPSSVLHVPLLCPPSVFSPLLLLVFLHLCCLPVFVSRPFSLPSVEFRRKDREAAIMPGVPCEYMLPFFPGAASFLFCKSSGLVHCAGGSTTNPAPPPLRRALRPGDTHDAGGPTTDPAPRIPHLRAIASAETSSVASFFRRLLLPLQRGLLPPGARAIFYADSIIVQTFYAREVGPGPCPPPLCLYHATRAGRNRHPASVSPSRDVHQWLQITLPSANLAAGPGGALISASPGSRATNRGKHAWLRW